VPDVEQPLTPLAAIEAGGELFIRLAKGDLAAADGQLQLDFDREADEEFAPPTLQLVTGPTTASSGTRWPFSRNRTATSPRVASYRDALLAGGSDVKIVFDLAHALQQLGRRDEAAAIWNEPAGACLCKLEWGRTH
jgi:hypothetical protein